MSDGLITRVEDNGSNVFELTLIHKTDDEIRLAGKKGKTTKEPRDH